ncbi:MAG: hypothetical protein E7395_06255 [Ruminococcaceae bacterium]|nr:hypothetical protein [Oscillospiraceae bacterium]
MAKKKEQTALIYNGKPLVKRGNEIIYGDINDKYYIHIRILDTETEKDLELATEVVVSLMEGVRIVKKAEREGIYRALDIGAFWLEDAMENNKDC